MDNKRACADKTRKIILKAALITFSKKGYSASTIRDIAKKANVHLNLIFHHFKSKELLWQAVGEVVMSEYRKYYLDKEFKLDLKATVHNFMVSRYNFFKDHPEYYRLLKWRSIEDNEKLNFVSSEYLKTIKPRLIKLQQAKLMRDDISVDVVAIYMASSLTGVFDKRNVLYQSDNPELLRKKYLDFIIEETYNSLKHKD